MSVFSVSICHIIFKFASIDITFSMPKSTLAFSFVKCPISFIMSTICPILDSISMSKFSHIFIILSWITWISFTTSHCTMWVLTHALTIRHHHLSILISLLHLTSIDRIIWIDIHISIYQSRLIWKLRKHLFIWFHWHMTVWLHWLSHWRSMLDKIVSSLLSICISFSSIHIRLCLQIIRAPLTRGPCVLWILL